jgi:hypothetical protein
MTIKSRPCAVCFKPIEEHRIVDLPETRLCDEHARKIEKIGGEFIRTSSLERTSKENSIKRNYGGVVTSKRRNDDAIAQLREEFLQEREQKG